jgi:hypothetical protein
MALDRWRGTVARMDTDWLRLTRVMTQYVVPGLLAVAFLVELTGTRTVPARPL